MESNCECSNAKNTQRRTCRRRNLETNMIVWLIGNTNDSQTQFRRTINFHEMFNDVAECIEYIIECQSEKIFFILTQSLCITVLPVIHNYEQVHSIYLLAEKQEIDCQEQQYSKVRGVYETIYDIHEALVREVAILTSVNDLPISCIPSSIGDSISSSSNRLEASFMYFQLLIDVLLSINVGNAKQDMINECRRQYDGDDYQLQIIDDFERQYTVDTAIEWYTRDSFLYRVLNKALRVQDIDILFKLRFFIKDLHSQLEKLYECDEKQQSGTIIVYRGQLLSADEFEKFKQNIGGFLSINNFMSTTTNRNIALIYSGGGLQRPSKESVLFEITVDQEKCQQPFHNIRDLSIFDAEDEVLFTMGMVCRIQSIQEVDCVWHIRLTSNEENDEDLKRLQLHMRHELSKDTDMIPFGQLLSKMGEYDKLVQFYMHMLAEIPDDDPKRRVFHNHLGATYNNLGKYEEALIHQKKNLDLITSQSSMEYAETYANLGIVYHSMNNFSEALTHMLKAQDIVEQKFPQYELKLSTIYNNIGSVYSSMNDLSNAYLYYEKSLVIKEKILPFNHPDLASTLNNLAEISFKRDNQEDALIQIQKVLDIDLQTLPSHHLSLANTYHNIALIQMKQKKYSQALENITKALNIAKISNHPDMHEYQQLVNTILHAMSE